MIETVLTLPIIMVLLLMLLYYGWSMARLQRAAMVDRYEAWRQVYNAPGPAITSSNSQINQAFWSNQAIGITDTSPGLLPDDTRDELVALAAAGSPEAGDLADALLYDVLPHGRSIRFTTSHDAMSEAVEAIHGPIRHTHTRIHNEWKFANGVRLSGGAWEEAPPRVTPGMMVANTFMTELDPQLESIAGGDSGAAASGVRGFYTRFPGYTGPEVDF